MPEDGLSQQPAPTSQDACLRHVKNLIDILKTLLTIWSYYKESLSRKWLGKAANLGQRGGLHSGVTFIPSAVGDGAMGLGAAWHYEAYF